MATMPIASLSEYTRTHWTGLQGLAWSFWVNLVGLRILISLAQSLTFTNRAADAAPLNVWFSVLLGFAHFAIFIWQVVGVLRAGERHVRHLGSITNVWGTQLGVLIALMFALSDIWGLWLMTNPATDPASYADQLARNRTESYTLQLSDDKTIIELSGDIMLGATKSVAAIFAANPQVNTLSLNSGGGNIYEARGLAKLVRNARLNTLAVNACSSACTIAFIGGASRQLAPGARLGFHQYRIDAAYDIPFVRPEAEQERDREFFRENGVKDWFVMLMFQEKPDNIWFPSAADLQRGGVVVSK